MPKVTWIKQNYTVDVPVGTSLLDCAIENDLPLEHACGGSCACTTCRIIVREGAQNISGPEEDEKELLGSITDFSEEVHAKVRLGCQAKIHGDVSVEIPE